VVDTLLLQTLNPLEHAVFQRVFGEIMTLLIALEFNHTMQYVITRERGIIQGKIVILIAQLALARKVIVTDPYEVPPTSVAALAALALALGATYWLMRDDPTGGGPGRNTRQHQRRRNLRSRCVAGATPPPPRPRSSSTPGRAGLRPASCKCYWWIP